MYGIVLHTAVSVYCLIVSVVFALTLSIDIHTDKEFVIRQEDSK